MLKAVKRFAEHRKLACAAFSAAAGCFAAANLPLSYGICIISSVCLLILSVIFRRKQTGFILLLACVMCAYAGYLSYRNVRPAYLPEGKFELNGCVCSLPIDQSDKGRTVLTLDAVTLDGESFRYKVRLYVYSADAEYEYGDELHINTAKLSVPDGASYDGGFDFNSYLWRNSTALTGSCQGSAITITGTHGSLTRLLYRIRQYLALKCDAVFGEHSDVMKAMLLGDKSDLTDETYYSFRQTGIAHIIALSGLHVSCLALILSWLFRHLRLRRAFCDILVISILILYTVMTGASASTVRAVIMFALLCFTLELGYPSDMLTRIACAFIVQTAFNPLIVFDTGFSLSYASIYAILCLNDLGNDIFHLGSEGSSVAYLREAGVTSLSVQIVTFPLMANAFGTIPLVSVPVNIIVVPFAIAALYCGFAVLGIACVWTEAAYIIAYPIRLIWQIIKLLAGSISGLQFTTLTVRAVPAVAAALFIIAAFTASPYLLRNASVKRWIYVALISALVIVSAIPIRASQELKLTFIDVNYGDSTLIEAEGRVYMLDCGKDNGMAADYVASTGFTLSGVFITHPDTDHCGGLRDVLSGNNSARIYIPDCWDEMDVGDETQSLLSGHDVYYLAAGDEVTLSPNVTARVLWPPENYIPDNDNDGSLVLDIVYGEASALFLADISDTMDSMCCAPAQILKVAHHGSKYATSAQMLEIVSPETAVISVSSNGFGHPTPEALARLDSAGADVYRTDINGAIQIEMFKDGTYTIDTYRSAEETNDE